jgi:hypothetical protein
MIADDVWNEWLQEVVGVLNTHEKLIKNSVGFFGKIKQLIEDYSRIYTALFVLDTLHQSLKDGPATGDGIFEADINKLQANWNIIMESIYEPRKVLIAQKCLEFFGTNFKDFESVATREELLPTNDAVEKWNMICKRCHKKGLNNDKSYKDFLKLLLVEMTKY